MKTLEERISMLEVAEAIRQLKVRYASLADQKYTADYQRQPDAHMKKVAMAQAACFTEDAVWEGGAEFGANLVGRVALGEWFQRSPWCFARHYYGSPEIMIHGRTASATWQLWQIALREETKCAVLLAAVTSEDYAQQQDGSWLCSRMRFENTHMLPVDAGPLPLVTSFSQIGRIVNHVSTIINNQSITT